MIDRVMEFGYVMSAAGRRYFFYPTHQWLNRPMRCMSPARWSISMALSRPPTRRLLATTARFSRPVVPCVFTEKGLRSRTRSADHGTRKPKWSSSIRWVLVLAVQTYLYVDLMRNNLMAIWPGAQVEAAIRGFPMPSGRRACPGTPDYAAALRDDGSIRRTVSQVDDFQAQVASADLFRLYTFCPDTLPGLTGGNGPATEDASAPRPTFQHPADGSSLSIPSATRRGCWVSARPASSISADAGLPAESRDHQWRTARNCFVHRYEMVPAESERRCALYRWTMRPSLYSVPGATAEFITKFAHGAPAAVEERLARLSARR